MRHHPKLLVGDGSAGDTVRHNPGGRKRQYLLTNLPGVEDVIAVRHGLPRRQRWQG
jgi:hypothetical protein